MPETVAWHGYTKSDIYSAQDDCLIAITDGKPVGTDLLRRIPPHRGALIVRIAKKAGIPLEHGTHDDFLAKAVTATGFDKLEKWWDD